MINAEKFKNKIAEVLGLGYEDFGATKDDEITPCVDSDCYCCSCLFWKERFCSRREKIKILKKVLIVLCIVAGVYTVTPSEETMYKMLVAQNVTYENVDKATEAIKDRVDYIFKKLGKEDKKK